MSDADDFVTIQLTGEWPIRVRRKEWPVISFAVGYDPDASNPDWSNIVLVRRGQVAEHGTSYIAHAMAFKKRKVTQADLETEDLVPDREGGYLMRGEIDQLCSQGKDVALLNCASRYFSLVIVRIVVSRAVASPSRSVMRVWSSAFSRCTAA